jgi:hypothetical protein
MIGMQEMMNMDPERAKEALKGMFPTEYKMFSAKNGVPDHELKSMFFSQTDGPEQYVNGNISKENYAMFCIMCRVAGVESEEAEIIN